MQLRCFRTCFTLITEMSVRFYLYGVTKKKFVMNLNFGKFYNCITFWISNSPYLHAIFIRIILKKAESHFCSLHKSFYITILIHNSSPSMPCLEKVKQSNRGAVEKLAFRFLSSCLYPCNKHAEVKLL